MREEMLAGLGWAYLTVDRPRVPRGQAAGVRELPNLNADAFDVTWRKTEGAYSPTTMYRDYAISPRLIHWESPSAQRADAAVTHRYVEHEQRGRHILLFARESKHGPMGTQPLMFLGTARYRSHEGERPVSFVWELDRALPADFYLASQVLTG